MINNSLILASLSPFRAKLLENAGLTFSVVGAEFNERSLDAAYGLIAPKNLAMKLAEAKAKDVSSRFPQAVVIGCDQTLEFEGQVVHKAANLEEAEKRLNAFSGKTHYLHSGIALARNGQIISCELSSASMTMRNLSSDFVLHYLNRNGNKVLNSVGTYQIEGEGIQLFERIDGDYFTIIGLPLLILLKNLRKLGIIDY